MWDGLEALRALAELGTTGKAATRLRITQSAVSKRIDALEAHLGLQLVFREGRGLRLTEEGLAILEEAAPVFAAFQRVMESRGQGGRKLALACSESLFFGPLPLVLRRAIASCGLNLELHAHRGPVVLQKVRHGEVDLGIAVDPLIADLQVEVMQTEEMVLAQAVGGSPDIWAIERSSLTWAAIESSLMRRHPRISVVNRLESSLALGKMAQAGFCRALVPRSTAEELGLPFEVLAGVSRRISVIGRPRTFTRPGLATFLAAIREGLGRSTGETPRGEVGFFGVGTPGVSE